MSDYSFTRNQTSYGWDIPDNPYHIDSYGNPIPLAKEVEAALPGMPFTLRCDGTQATFSFDSTLSPSEETTLNNTVETHRLDTEGDLDGVKLSAITSIDTDVQNRIINGTGYEYPPLSGKYLSLSLPAQIKINGLFNAKDFTSFSYPINVRTKDDKQRVTINDSVEATNMFDAAVDAVRILLDVAEQAKEDVMNSTSKAAVDAILTTYLNS